MKYAVANRKVIKKLGAKGIFIDYPFDKTVEKHSVYELKKGDVLYVNSYSWYMSYFWVNRNYLKRFDIKIVEMVENELYIYDYPKKDAVFEEFLNIKTKNISKVYTPRKDIAEYLKDIYEIDKSGIDLEKEFKPYVLNRDVMRIIDSLAGNVKEKKDYVDYILSSKLSLLNPFASLAACWLKKNALSDKKIAFYSINCAYRAHMLSKNVFEKSGGVFLYSQKCDDRYEKMQNSYYLPKHLISCMDNFKIIFYTALDSVLPLYPKKVYIQHDIFDSPFGYAEKTVRLPGKMILSAALEKADKIFIASKPVKEAYEKLLKPFKAEDKLFEFGYMKLDRNYKALPGKKIQRFVIYAPSLLDKKCYTHHSIPHFAELLFDRLLDKEKIIFRPHPQNYSHPLVKKIIKKYKKHMNFYYDSDANDYLDSYASSKIMISDISGTAYTYAFLTGNPVLFLSPNEKFIKKDLGDLNFFRFRRLIGEVAENFDEFEEKFAYLLRKKPIYKIKSKNLRDKLIYNFLKSEEVFLNFLKKEINES